MRTPVTHRNIVNIERLCYLGIETDLWKHKSCQAEFGFGSDWGTLYLIESKEEGKGHATELLKKAKKYYERKGLKFGGSIALNPVMSHIYTKLQIEEYK